MLYCRPTFGNMHTTGDQKSIASDIFEKQVFLTFSKVS